MCGILGYMGEGETARLLINGLKQLEYRGYDSAGICVVNGGGLNTIKSSGRICELEKDESLVGLNGNLGIAHTRWATHGKPNDLNAHPHLDCKGEIAIVHNGIIENYYALKELLKREGHEIVSDSDSEIIAHLIEKFYSGDLEYAVFETLKLLEGTFGLAVVHKDKDEIVAAKRGSPLVVGVGDDELFVSSDVFGIINHTKRVIYLNDGDMVVIKNNSYFIKDSSGNNVDKEVYEIKWEVEQIEKAGFKHFMLKEIFEQPETIRNVLRGRIKEGEVKLGLDLDFNVDRIVIVACGTSWHSALIGKYIIEKVARIPVEVDYASEFRYRNPIVKKDDLVVAISQSGETADTLAAIKEAKQKNSNTIGIVNVVGSTISREVDSGIYLHAGPEIGVASTKAFTSQVLALFILALFMNQKKGFKVEDEVVREILSLPEKVGKILESSGEVRRMAEKFKDSKNFIYLGRGINFPVALEGALKLKEISYIHAEGYPAAEMKHGPIALIDGDMPVIFLASKDQNYEKVLNNIEEVKSRGGRIITIATEKDDRVEKLSEDFFIVPETIEELSPILNVIFLQLLAYHISDLKGIDVDKPRNLAKSVTVE